MKEKVKIFEDHNAKRQFQSDVSAVCESANQLIEIYQLFQPWQQISTLTDFEDLISDPKSYYDKTILANVELKVTGIKADPGKLAELVGLNRNEFLHLVDGLPLTDTSCKPCQQITVRKGQKAVSRREFDSFAEYLIFRDGRFIVDEIAVNDSLSRFDVYATSPAEIERYNLFADLIKTLNVFTRQYPISYSDRQAVAKMFHLQLTRASEGDFRLNDEYLKNEILYLKYSK